jgi:hypothetical protein
MIGNTSLFSLCSFKRCLLAGALALCGINPARATMMKYLSVEDLTRNASDVFQGQVVSTRSYWDAERTRIFTAVRVQLSECYKGTAKRGQVVTITQLGGELDGRRLDYAGRPEFAVGEAVVLFTKAGRQGDFVVVGLKQGMLRVKGDQALRDFSGITLLDSTGALKQSRPVPVQTRVSLDELRQRIASAR